MEETSPACSFVVYGSQEPIEAENLVEFHLLYSGQLHSAGRPTEKHAIRRIFHSQLRQLWGTNSNLKEMVARYGMFAHA
jgi:hypothetical protein